MLWQDPCIILYINTDTERFLASLFSSSTAASDRPRLAILGHHIRRLCLDRPGWTDARLLQLLPHLSGLGELTVDLRSNITDTSFQHVSEHCTHLTSLHIYVPSLTRISFAALGQQGTALRELEWVIGQHQTSEWLALLAPCGLEHLSLSCEAGFIDERGLAAIQQLDSLTSLTLSDSMATPMNKLFQRPSSTAPPLWPRMTSRDLSPCDHLDNALLLDFIESHPQLEELYLDSVKQLDNAILNNMAKGLPHLKALELHGNSRVTVDGLFGLIRQCLCLEHIRLSGFQRAMERHFQHGEFATHCTSSVADWGIVLHRESMNKIRQKGINGNSSSSSSSSSP